MNTTGSIDYIYIILVVSLVDEYIYSNGSSRWILLDQLITYIYF